VTPRRRRALVGAALLLALLVVGWGVARWLWPAHEPDRYSVVEGDTLAWRPPQCLLSTLGIACLPQRLRLYGVDAFERKQTCRDANGKVWPCGAVATARLHQLVESGDFACHVDHEFIDRHAREFAVCTAHGEDVGAVLVSEGLAFAYGRGAQYLPYESAARVNRRGAWAGSFVRPQYFREGADQ
jgi:endonuclease YncB( thermonuclease family)